VVGIITNRDMRFASDDRTPVKAMMTAENLAILREPADRAQAIAMMKERRIEKLLVTDASGHLTGLLTLKDTEKSVLNPWPARTSWAGCAWAPPRPSAMRAMSAALRWSRPASIWS
jgi:CBS-domain-containing membrane protein